MAFFAAATLFGASCVPQAKYDQLAQDCTSQSAKADRDQKAAAAEMAELKRTLREAETASQVRDEKLSELTTANHNAQAQIDSAAAWNQQLRDELGRVGADVDKVQADRGVIAMALQEARARLDLLRRAQASAEARTALFRDLATKFAPLIAAQQLAVGSRDSRLTITIPSDLLFDGGHADVDPRGRGVVLQLAKALSAAPQRFQIAVHTDKSPAGGAFATRWDLSVARAGEIVKLLVVSGVREAALSAAGFADGDPLTPNDTAAARAKNRRVEITVRPDAEDLVVAPQWPPN